ncbi:MAG: class I SAM-dependent methyltransferase [Magnetococcales bacterium]|nr:class I SAM-dependent methyltransferase [Magnetococcales bacterium]
MISPQSAVVVTAQEPDQLPAARALAERLGLEGCDWTECDNRLVLNLTATRLELVARLQGRGQPVFVEFSEAIAKARRQEGLRQTLARAVGLKAGVRPRVLDATPGLGRDAFVLAALGCPVEMVERSPVVHALLADGLRRARLAALPEAARMELHHADAIAHLAHRWSDSPPVAVVYLDPMHPERHKAALVKKEMRQLRLLVGDDTDSAALLQAALSGSGQRVVVKRPRLSPPLADIPAQAVVSGQTVRYDLYFT